MCMLFEEACLRIDFSQVVLDDSTCLVVDVVGVAITILKISFSQYFNAPPL